MPSGAKKRRAARRRKEKEANIKSSTDSNGLSSDTGSKEIDDANVLVPEGIVVDDLAKPVCTLAKDVAALGSKEDDEKTLPPIQENILDEPHSVMNTHVVVEMPKLVGAVSEEASNIDDIVTGEKFLPSVIEDILAEPNSVIGVIGVTDLANEVDTLSDEASNIDDLVTEEKLLASVIEDILVEPNSVMDVIGVTDLANEVDTLSDEVTNVDGVLIEDEKNILDEPHSVMNAVVEMAKPVGPLFEEVSNVDDIAMEDVTEEDSLLPSLHLNILEEPHPALGTLAVVDSAKPDDTLSDEVIVDYEVTEGVFVFGLKENNEKKQPSVFDNILVEPNSVMGEIAVADLANEVDTLSDEITNVDGVLIEDEENVLGEPHSLMNARVVVEMANPVGPPSEEVSNVDDIATEDVTKEDSLLPSLHLNILEEPHPALGTLAVVDSAKPDDTLSDEVSVDYEVTEGVFVFGLKENDEKKRPSVIDNILVEPNSVMGEIAVADLANKVVSLSDEITNVNEVVTEDVVSSGLKEIEEKTQASVQVEIMDEPNAMVSELNEEELNEAGYVLQASNENAGSSTSSTTTEGNLLQAFDQCSLSPVLLDITDGPHEIVSEVNEAENGVSLTSLTTISLGSKVNEDEHLDSTSVDVTDSEHKSLETKCASEKIPPDQCPLHCSFYQWINKELSKASTGGVNKAEDEDDKNMRCVEQLDRIKKFVEAELQVSDKMGMLLRNLLNDLNSNNVPQGQD